MAKVKPDWKKVKIAYQKGEGSCRELAEKFGLSEDSVQNKCKRAKWRKEKAIIDQKVTEKVTEKIVDAATKWVDDTLKRAERYRGDIDASREQCGTTPDGKALMDPDVMRDYATVELKMDDMARRSLGLSDAAQKVDITMSLADLLDADLKPKE